MRLSVLFLSISFVILASCSTSSVDKIPDAEPLPLEQSFTGVWYSPQFEQMNLKQVGDKVTGIFTFKTGGTISGTVDGNLLIFDWTQPGNRVEARRTFQGKGYLQLKNVDGKPELVGKWGYNESATRGGPWNATFTRKLEPTDFITLESWRDSGMMTY